MLFKVVKVSNSDPYVRGDTKTLCGVQKYVVMLYVCMEGGDSLILESYN